MAQNSKESEDHSKAEGLYPIRTVSSLTGVNSITLRAWERRYGLIKPVRTPKGHRLYTQNDIDLIQQVLELLDKGISIGQVKDHLQGSAQETFSREKSDPWSAYQRRMLNAIVRFDVNGLDNTYNDALSLYPVEMVTKHLILPLLKTLGLRWESAEGSIAEEHFFGAYLRNKLGARFHHHPTSLEGPAIVAACMPGEQHEIGLMLFCLSALTHGYRIVYLGADTPLDEIVTPVERSESQAVLLSGSVEPQAQALTEQLPSLVSLLNVPVFIGGSTAVKYRDAIVEAGAIPLGTDISLALRRIDEELGSVD
ncbi:MAG: MerR family transcriptional regulator [Gammaproteobacteria bacterium]|nr:MerR family transcriptional regulator [Gammaproteobacteria bacterium]